MSEENVLEALKAKHAALEAAIDEENERPLPDDIKVKDLKRQKLKVKEDMEKLSSDK
jgi:hypothetical protein